MREYNPEVCCCVSADLCILRFAAVLVQTCVWYDVRVNRGGMGNLPLPLLSLLLPPILLPFLSPLLPLSLPLPSHPLLSSPLFTLSLPSLLFSLSPLPSPVPFPTDGGTVGASEEFRRLPIRSRDVPGGLATSGSRPS